MSMRIVATSDTHFPFSPRMIPEGDIFVHAGDLMYDGIYPEWERCLKSFVDINDRTVPFKQKFYIPGNHDLFVDQNTGPANQHLRREAGVIMLGTHPKYMTTTLPNGMVMLGLPFVTKLYGWAFNRTEEELDELLRAMPRADIVVSHSPPRIDGMDGLHYGVEAYTMYQLIHKPAIWINGHVHECYGEHAHNGTMFYNVAMCDRKYEQVNKPFVIELDDA